ncbi:bacterial translation initiation factor 2 (bIF-2) [Chthonomonas calidirosea]|uniref:translation initiation factor IF-2 n=1 Tax=Chthonomonas calidirosea TaxID=454171 RepID=UPI0006DD4984|nr:translation initiation factor IF-2 [Chthonomonas calidirosea]CEK20128.1 bacterial translation initiation factor 2 (bIF-2) [Chthonomonas calidirosea]
MIEARGIRVTELAKTLNITVAELTSALQDLGIAVSDPNSTVLDHETATAVQEMLGQTATSAREIEVPANATLKEVAEAIGISPTEATKKMMELGELIGPHQRLSNALAERLAAAYGFKLRVKSPPSAPATSAPKNARYKPGTGTLQPRPPVVTVMGHVDHGKTSLLDAIRKTHVAEGEFGGITQHIGAYQVEIQHNGQPARITFLDTPGHEAFTQMRARGASVTDIVVLVVAADDGVMPQTVEAIHHAQAAEVPLIVAINKIDKPDARPDRVKQQLAEHNLLVEEYGGDVPVVEVSAKTGQGIQDLLEYILLLAELHDLKADPNGPVRGTIIEAKIEPGRGPVATVLVQSGTLRVGDSIVAGLTYGKVRAMTNERGERLQKAPPSTPVEVLGLNSVPMAGDVVEVVKNEKEARQIAEKRQEKVRAERLTSTTRRISLADLSRQVAEEATKDFNLIVKADVQGSLEAVLGQINKIAQEAQSNGIHVSVKHSGIGAVTESDVSLAVATESVIIGFNVRTDAAAQKAAERDGVDIRLYNIIYDLTEDLQKAVKGLLTPVYEEVVLGRARVLQRFQTPKGLVIAGCSVIEGKVVRGAEVRIIRNKEKIFTSRIESLRRLKDDVREVLQGYECGMVIENWTDVQPDDIIECYEMQEVARS